MIPKLTAFLRANLAPNRVGIYLTTAADVGALLIVLFSDLGLPQVAAVVAAVAAVNAKLIKFLGGWQQYESALLQRDLIAFKSNTDADAYARGIEATQAVSKPGLRPGVQLPR